MYIYIYINRKSVLDLIALCSNVTKLPQQFSPSLPLLARALGGWYEMSAPGHTPEPCYATAPNNDHLLLQQFSTSQDVPAVYTWIIYSPPPSSPPLLLPLTHIHCLGLTDHSAETMSLKGGSLNLILTFFPALCATPVFLHVCSWKQKQ